MPLNNFEIILVVKNVGIVLVKDIIGVGEKSMFVKKQKSVLCAVIKTICLIVLPYPLYAQ